MNRTIEHAIEDILFREMSGGGFRYSDSGPPAAEPTAWTVIALKSSASHLDVAVRACDWLTSIQQTDGRVVAVEGCNEAFWPTPVCIYAWKSMPGYQKAADAGIQFLLGTKGRHSDGKSGSPLGHDPAIVGWPWVEKTHSWIEPTSLSIIALKLSGYQDHPRTREGIRLLLDRQLPHGGWNYGNTTVFGRELLPIPENTGQALCALAGMTDVDNVKKSLTYIEACATHIRTPIALAWMLRGLAGWSLLPKDWESFVVDCLKLQNRYGPYDTVALSQLVSVYCSKEKLLKSLV